MTTPLPSPPRRWPWLRFAGLVLLALVVASVWKMVLRYQATSELRAAGFATGPPINQWQMVRRDWHLLLKHDFWRAYHFVMFGDPSKAAQIRTLEPLIPALRRLAVEDFRISNCPNLENVDALKDVQTLEYVSLHRCPALRNIDALAELKRLEVVDLDECLGLENIDALRGLTALKEIHLYRCNKLSLHSLSKLKSEHPNAFIIGPRLEREDAIPPLAEGD